ncbi:hypothetical protein HDZ31DRAFT_30504 [Schizophyllum fasciatum]
MSGDVRATVSSIQKATKRQRKKDILAGVESLQAILSLLDLSSPSESSIQKLIASIRSPLLPLYADHADPMLGFCRAVLIYISDKKIGAFTGPGKDALRELWEPVLESLINGVIDFLEYSTKKTDGQRHIKSCIGGKLYPTFCRLYFPKEQDDIISVGPSLLSTVYMLMSDAAIRHSDNRRRLRSSDSLGARRIGWMLAQTKEFVVIEHLLEVFATALPSSKDQGGKSRQQYIEDVFDPALFHSHGEAIKILANMRSADWSETSPHIMAALAEGSLAYPQPFDVTDFLVGGVPEKLDYGKLYIDNKGFYANVEQDEAFDHLKAAYSTVIDIRIIQSQNAVKVVHVTLESPPVVGKEPYCTAQSGRNYNLKFLVQATDLDRFKNSLKARGLVNIGLSFGGKMLSGGKRVSTAEVVVEFDKDPVTPLPSTQSKVKRVEEVWNSSTVEGPIVLEPTSPLLNDSGDVLPAPPKSTRPKPRPKQAGVDKEGDSNKDPFVISRKRMRVPDSDDEADDGKKKSRTGTSTSVKGRPTEAVVPLADGFFCSVPRRPLRDKKRPSPASEALTLGSTDGHPPAAKRARPSDKENPRSKTATRELFNMQKPGKPARVAKRYGKAGRSSSPGRKSGRPSSPQTVIATNIASDFDFIPGGEVVKSGGAGKAPPKRQGKVTEKPAETKVKIAAVTKGRKAGNGKPEEKTAQKKGRAIDKGKSTSSASSDPIEEDISISKSARTRNNELLASKATSTIAKVCATCFAAFVAHFAHLQKAELTNARPATNTTRKSESAPWEDIMSVQRTPAKSQGKSKTSKLLAAMDNNLSSPIFGGFDEPLTPIQESDTEVYMDFVQDLPTGLPITKGNLIAGMYPPSPSPPEILQRTKSQEGIRKGRRDYKSQDTPIGRASPLVDKLARDVPFPRPAKVYTRPEATKARAYAGIEDIIEVLNDIHEVIIDKVSGRFVAVKKEVRVGRHSILIDAANDFRVMNRESLEHYETVFSLQEEYANHCRNIVDAWAALHQAGRDLTKSIVEVVQRHDRGSLVMKFPTSLVPSLPESLKSAS